MIQTSFFSSKAPKERKVCIAKWHRNWTGPRAPLFAPSNPKAVDWQAVYWRDLEERFPDAESLKRYLQEIERQTRDPILCCFEKDQTQCHRRVLATFIRNRLGIDVPEWSNDEPEQFSLV